MTSIIIEANFKLKNLIMWTNGTYQLIHFSATCILLIWSGNYWKIPTKAIPTPTHTRYLEIRRSELWSCEFKWNTSTQKDWKLDQKLKEKRQYFDRNSCEQTERVGRDECWSQARWAENERRERRPLPCLHHIRRQSSLSLSFAFTSSWSSWN